MSSGTYKGTTPTTPKLAAVRDEKRGDEDPTLVKYPTCAGSGCITYEAFVALELEARRRENEG